MTRLLLLIIVSINCSYCLAQPDKEKPVYFATAGVFAFKSNARKLLHQLQKDSFKHAAITEEKKMFFVYIEVTSDRALADSLVQVLKTKNYSDAYIKDSFSDEYYGPRTPRLQSHYPFSNDLNKRNNKYLFEARDRENGASINGLLELNDPVNASHWEIISQQITALEYPTKELCSYTLEIDLVGYKKLEKRIADLQCNQMEDIFKISIFLERDRVQSLPIRFYNDAAIMFKESETYLHHLVQQLSLQKTMRIKLHGHANGKHWAKMIVPATSDNYFYPNKNIKSKFGSPKKLSRERAKCVKQYLINAGIDRKRIDITGWGGRKPVTNHTSEDAHRNLRVELEVVSY